VQAVTGTGKTRVGIEAISGELSAGGQVLVLVPTRALHSQWYDLLWPIFGKHAVGRRGDGGDDNFESHPILLSTPQSASGDLRFSGVGLLVADECHRYGADTWRKSLDPRFAKRLGLSATYERADAGDEYLGAYFGRKPILDIVYERAISDGIVSPFRLAFVGVDLGELAMSRYEEYSAACGKARALLLREYFTEKEEHSFGEFMKAVMRAKDGAYEGRAQRKAFTYLKNFALRRDILADASEKLRRLDSLTNAVRTARGTLVFTQTRAAAETATALFASKGLSAATVYGDLDRHERSHILQCFKDGETAVVSAPRVLDEGIDVPEADLAIVLSASSGRRQMIQRMGRVLRVKTDGRRARFAVLYAVNTSEDPALGAHESFIEIASDVAEVTRNFKPEASGEEICHFLRSGA